MSLTLKLIDNDYKVCAQANLGGKGNAALLRQFVQQVREELVPGQTAYLEIEAFEAEPVSFEICRHGC